MSLKHNNQFYSFVSTDNGNTYEFIANGKVMYLTKKEAKEQIKRLQNKGFKQSSVIVKNSQAKQGVTGAYNIKDIKIKTKQNQ